MSNEALKGLFLKNMFAQQEQSRQQGLMQDAGAQFQAMAGQMAQPAQTAPVTEAEMMGPASPDGTMQLQPTAGGGGEITQHARDATGMFQQGMSSQDKYNRLNRQMMGSGNAILQKQAMSNLGNMQNSMMQIMKEEGKSSDGTMSIKDLTGINNKTTDMLKKTQGMKEAANQLDALKQSSTLASQTAAVFAFMKAIDPSSTVRESELGMVYSAEGAAKGFANKINALLGEGELSPENFSDLVDTANVLANDQISSATGELNSFLDVYEGRARPQTLDKMRNRMPKQIRRKIPNGILGFEDVKEKDIIEEMEKSGMTWNEVIAKIHTYREK